MTKAVKLVSLYFLSTLILPIFVVGKPNGLTLKLIDRDSPESPLYPGNLTYIERMQRLVQQSKARAQYLSSRLERTIHPDTVRGLVDVQPTDQLMVQVGIGTFPNQSPRYISYFLVLDTGAQLTWTQCEDCKASGHHCFNQTQPLFPRSKSSSFHPISCNDPACSPHQCSGAYCTYQVEFLAGPSSTGILGRDMFTFRSTTGPEESVQVMFGCGFDQKNYHYGTGNRIAGILGLGFGQRYRSFLDQIRPQTNGRFSYCVPPTDNNGHVPPTFLRFGADIPRRNNLSSTRLLRYPDDTGYHLKLMDISVANKRLGIPERYLIKTSGNTGSIIDSGSPFSYIADYPFSLLTNGMINYFPKDSGFHLVGELYGFNLCFERPDNAGFGQLPKITFHFEGADLELRPENLYVLGDYGVYRFFCSTIMRSESMNIIGVYQQRNQRIIYDTQNMMLHFGPENCVQNA